MPLLASVNSNSPSQNHQPELFKSRDCKAVIEVKFVVTKKTAQCATLRFKMKRKSANRSALRKEQSQRDKIKALTDRSVRLFQGLSVT